MAVSGALTPEQQGRANAKRRANASIKHALLNAFDTLGNEAYFVELGRGSAEDRRCLANIFAKLLPIEVSGALDATLTIKVVSQVGGEEIVISERQPRIPKEPVTYEATPVPPLARRALEESGA